MGGGGGRQKVWGGVGLEIFFAAELQVAPLRHALGGVGEGVLQCLKRRAVKASVAAAAKGPLEIQALSATPDE